MRKQRGILLQCLHKGQEFICTLDLEKYGCMKLLGIYIKFIGGRLNVT